jgi:peptidoglycan-associated lipoprotein
MKSVYASLLSLSLGVLALAACSSAPEPAKPSTAPTQARAATTAEKPAEAAAAPAEAAKPEAPPEASAVKLKAEDSTGKPVALDLKNIYFDYDKYVIRAQDKPAVDHNAAQLKQMANVRVTIEGHCDERGTTEYNLALGEHRAVAVMNALAAAGIQKSRLKTVSYGKEKPADPGHTEDAWAKNRRSVPRES